MARNGNAKTRRFALNMLKVSVAISGAALLFACGDDDSSFVASENGGSAAEADIVVATFDYLLNCTDNREGKTAYIKDEKATYVCVDGDWITGSISESVDDLINCTSKHEGETAFVKEDKEIYVCTDADWVVAGETGNEGDGDDDDGDDAEKKSSSSTAKSADSKDKSSSDKEVSSSSVTQSSSSSVTLSEVEGSSSSSVIPGSDPESSSSVESSRSRGFFDMTKDEFLNPKVSYGEMTDTRDNKIYKTVKIGDQVWMAENLNYADSTKTPSLKGNSWCYDNKIENCAVTGRLYTWAAAIDSVALANDADNPQTCGYGKTCTLPTVVQGVCPEGWHLPSNDEWETLFKTVAGYSEVRPALEKAGTALKSQTGWYSQTGDAADRDAYGFSALPAGNRDLFGSIDYAGYYADFWSASEYDRHDYAAHMGLSYKYEFVALYVTSKDEGLSVRCLQN